MSDARVRVAIAGIGNCASSLVQGVEYYRKADPSDDVPGLMHVVLGGYHVGDVEFVAVRRRRREGGPRPRQGHPRQPEQHDQVRQHRAPRRRGATTFDGLGHYYREEIEESPRDPVDVADVLRDSGADVLVSYLPVGSEEAQRFYAQACLDAGVGS